MPKLTKKHNPPPKMIVRRTKAKNKTVYDTQGERITFEEISTGTHSVYTAEVNNMVQREIPVGQLFTLFGAAAIIKAEFISDQNFCRLSVLDGKVYSHDGDGTRCKVITYGDMKHIIETYPTGECVDAVLCASYERKGALTLAPYVYDWKDLPIISKIIRALLVGLLLAVVVYGVKDTTVKDFAFLLFMMVKDNLVPLVTALV